MKHGTRSYLPIPPLLYYKNWLLQYVFIEYISGVQHARRQAFGRTEIDVSAIRILAISHGAKRSAMF